MYVMNVLSLNGRPEGGAGEGFWGGGGASNDPKNAILGETAFPTFVPINSVTDAQLTPDSILSSPLVWIVSSITLPVSGTCRLRASRVRTESITWSTASRS